MTSPDEPADILVVDDTPANVTLLVAALEDQGHRCRVATSGRRALAAVEASPPELVLLDIMMPDLDGYEVCRRLKSDPATARIPILFVSALGEPFDKVRAFDAGGADYVTKPFFIAELHARVRHQIRIARLQRALEALTLTDPLTGVANRRRFEEALGAEWDALARRGEPLALLLADVDHFKLFNDHRGHVAGDHCLRKVAGALQAIAGPGELAARYGGEEFAMILPGADAVRAGERGEALRRAVRDLGVPHPASPLAPVVTISVGAAATRPRPNENPASLVEAADRALYQAKQKGRDRAELAD